MNIAYHLCGALLEKGSIILPGSFGHIVQNVYGTNEHSNLGNPQFLYYEEKLEAYRQRHVPHKPSRFDCVFVCHTLENLKKFVAFSNRQFQFGYRVEVLGDFSNAHFADWERYDNKWTERNDWKTAMEHSVHDYWQEDRRDYMNHNDSPLEILTPHKIKILDRVL
jgi:hypothetical protein